MDVSSPKRLNEYLRETKTVKVDSQEGHKFVFRIHRISMASWDPDNSWYAKLMAGDPKALEKRIMDEIASPPTDVIKKVLLDGIAEPEITEDKPQDAGSAVWIQDLLRSDLLCRRLYAEVADLAFKGIAEVKVPENAKPRSPS